MKNPIKLTILATAFSAFLNHASASVIYYNGTDGQGDLDASFSTTGTTGQVGIDPAHWYYPTSSPPRYYGGSVAFNRSGGEWNGTRFQFLIGNAANPWSFSPMIGNDSALADGPKWTV